MPTLKPIEIHYSKDPISKLKQGEKMSPWEYRSPSGIAITRGNVGTIRATAGRIKLSGYRKASMGKSFLRSTILAGAAPLEQRNVFIPYGKVYQIRKKEESFFRMKSWQFDIHHDLSGVKTVESFTVFDVGDAKMLDKFLSEACGSYDCVRRVRS